MRYRLRTLLIVLALGPILLAALWAYLSRPDWCIIIDRTSPPVTQTVSPLP
jgi:hypothetical protein